MHKKMQAYIQKSDEVIKRSANRNYALIRINREQRDVIIRCIKRMKKKDKDRAKESERKRVENIAYLKEHINEKNNRRVLEGLEEDLMAL